MQLTAIPKIGDLCPSTQNPCRFEPFAAARRFDGVQTPRVSIRLARSPAEAEGVQGARDFLHTPPADREMPGRMNAAGVRVFCGALEERTAVAEVWPPICSHVVVGAISPTRSLRILDLGAFGRVFDYADLFSAEFEAISTPLSFLHMLEHEMSPAVYQHDEVLDANSGARADARAGTGS